MQDYIGEAITRVRENCTPRYIVWVGGVDDHYDTLEEALDAYNEWLDKGYTHVQVEVAHD
tara:strand:- start:1752 stop:1931 length:180 start_codon:yes stop_codon:yes gene_type:complete